MKIARNAVSPIVTDGHARTDATKMKKKNLLKMCQKALDYRVMVCKHGGCTELHPCRTCRDDMRLIEKIAKELQNDNQRNEG